MPRISAVIRLTAISMEQKMRDASAKNTAQKAHGEAHGEARPIAVSPRRYQGQLSGSGRPGILLAADRSAEG